jgi:cytochrome P450 monooxygenase
MRDGLPILPGAFPVVGHVPLLYRDAPEVVRRASAELGPLFWITAGPGNWVLIVAGASSVELFHDKRFTSAHLRKMAPLVAGESLLGLDGAEHRHQRSAMNGPLLPRGLSSSVAGSMMARSLAALVAGWAERGRARVLPEIQEVALEIIFQVIGIDAKDLAEWRRQYRDLLLANLGIEVMFPGSPAYRATRAAKWINGRFAEIIAAARREPDPATLIGALVRATDEDGAPLTDAELTHNLRLLVLGGHETISGTMAWMTVELASRAEVWDAVCGEAKAAPATPSTPQEARAFPIAESLFRETVRVHPSFGMITRVATEPVSLHGHTIPKDAVVGINIWEIAHDPALYDAPDEFKPKRWIGRAAAPSPVEIAEFGAGPHFCLGYHLAWLEAVQFAVALGGEMGRQGLRPRLAGGRRPGSIYLPTDHPPAKTVVEFVAN